MISIDGSTDNPNSNDAAPSPELLADPANRRLPPEFIRSEITLHLIFFAMAAVIVLFSIFMRTDGKESVFLPWANQAMPETCTSKRMFGMDCPGCGLTRSFISISHGDIGTAWRLNRASFVVYAFVAIQIPWHLLQIWRLRKKGRPFDIGMIYMLPIGVVCALFVNWIWKICEMWIS